MEKALTFPPSARGDGSTRHEYPAGLPEAPTCGSRKGNDHNAVDWADSPRARAVLAQAPLSLQGAVDPQDLRTVRQVARPSVASHSQPARRQGRPGGRGLDVEA